MNDVRMTRADPHAYTAELYGSSWSRGPVDDFDTITEARRWAESFGTTADRCVIATRSGRVVAEHVRDTNGDGTRWFRATIRKPSWEEIANARRDPHPIPDFPPRHRDDPA